MSIFQELDYNSRISKITGVQFSILSPDEIRRRSVAEIFTQETYDNDKPKIGGLFDPRMGIIDHGTKCPTDQLDNRQCPGYFGHIELALPVFHIQYLKYILQTLKCVCWKCSKLLVDINDEEVAKIISKRKGSTRFASIIELCSKIKRCGEKNINGCGVPKPNVIKKNNNGIGKLIVEWKLNSDDEVNKQRVYWDASDCLRILRRIKQEEYEAMGYSSKFCKPEWLICSVFGVPPPSVRPSVRASNNTRMEDDLTHKLCDIVKTSRTLKYKLEQKAHKKIIDEWYQLLQYHIATFVDNTLPGIPPAQQRSGRPLKSIKERLKSKEGRVRGNLMGKRVDYSARSVITPDPNIGSNVLGVPIDIAKNLTYPEKVTKYNIETLSKIVRNGYNSWPGAKNIKRIKDGNIISLKVIDTSNYKLELGDIVNRNLQDNDIVLFNRQPSLHKMSMMCHKVKVLPYKTFRLNVSVTTPYNADFDGDEMNMHVPQSIQTAVEIEELASVETQIITPAQHKPIIGLVQDSIIGSYLFTRYDNYLTKREVLDVLIWIKTFKGDLPKPDILAGTPLRELPDYFPKYKYDTKQDLWSGRTLFSIIIPNINIIKKNMSYDFQPNFQNKVIINKGVVENGVFDKSILGTKEQGIVHIIHNQYGNKKAMEFLNDSQNLVTNWMLMSGFSVGLGDLMTDDESSTKISEIINSKKKQVIELIEHVHSGILKNDTGKPNSEIFEMNVMNFLNKATVEAGQIGTKYLDSDNRMVNLVNSGSKGSDINIGQMIACVGQQSVDGKRIPYGFTDRTLPHFHKYDDGASARGFVENSFVNGLTPIEFFFHAMGGREGLIDTAVKTSETGYIQRKLVKAMEDIRIESDYTVRDADGYIIQFLYGEDGMEPIKIEKQEIPTIMMDFRSIEKKYKLNIDDNWSHYIEPKVYKKFMKIKAAYVNTSFDNYFNKLIQDKTYLIEKINNFSLLDGGTVYYPINLRRIITNARNNFVTEDSKSDLDPMYILEKINELEKRLTINNNIYSENKLFMMLVVCYLSPKVLIQELSLNKVAFDYIIGNITQQFFNSICEPGELVGVISAQSIGEPSTQMTLNTFHFAGVSSKSQVTRGLSRFKELLSATKNVKSPFLTIFLKDEYSTNKELATKVLNDIALTTIKQLIVSSEIYFDNNSDSLDGKLMQIYKEFEELDVEEPDHIKNPWILKFKFNKKIMIDKNIKMIDIYYAINNKFNTEQEDIYCTFTDDNASELILRIQYLNSLSEKTNDCSPEEDTICILKSLETTILNDIVLTGINNITNASMIKNEYLYKFNIDSNSFEKNPEWVIDTEGTNLIDIFKHPFVDTTKTFSNDIHEIYEVLGIEAARNILIHEINEVFAQSSSYVNHRHLSLLVDTMTNKGYLMSVDRHGINKSSRGPLAKCSFEETPDIIAKAAIFGELDNVQGVSSNIMLGQEVPCGTGSIDILFDEEKFIDLMGSMNIEKDKVPLENEETINEKNKFLDKLCNPNIFTDNLFEKL